MATVFVVSKRGAADILVHEVDHKGEADLLVNKVSSRGLAWKKDELWCEVKHKSEATSKICWINTRGGADLNICFVNSKGEAGWRTNHLLQGKLGFKKTWSKNPAVKNSTTANSSLVSEVLILLKGFGWIISIIYKTLRFFIEKFINLTRK